MQRTQDQTLTQGPLNLHILRLSIPTMFGLLLQAVYDIVDMIWIGHIDASAIAAATLFSTFFWIVEVLNEIIGTSSVSLISQSYGANDKARTQLISEQTLLAKLLFSCAGAIFLGLFLNTAFSLFTDDPKVIAYGMEYGIIRVIGIPIFFSSYSINTIFRCTGNAKIPMVLLIISSVINMIADPLLMFDIVPGTTIQGLGWGMKGAAIATVGSITLSFLLGWLLLLRGKAPISIRWRNVFVANWEIVKKLIVIGFPSGINQLLRNLSLLVFLKLVALYGTSAIAVVGVAIRIYSFGLMPSWGLMMGSGVIIGQHMGAQEKRRARLAVTYTTLDCILLVGILSLPIFFSPRWVLSLFMGGSHIPPEGISLMRIIGPCMLLSASMSGMGAAFIGSGKNKPLLYASLISQWGILIPYALFVALYKALPISFLWAAFLWANCAELMVRYICYRTSRWLDHRV